MSDADNVSSSKKTKDRIQQLSELRRGLVHHTDAQYGTPNDPMFVMHIIVDGMVFQGVGPSKKRAKVMASERALAHLGVIDASLVEMPELETPHVDDHTADVFTGLLHYSFKMPSESAADASLKLPFYRPENMEAYEECDTYSMQEAFENYIGRNAVSIMSEIRPDAQYEILFASCNTNPTRFVTGVRLRGQTYCGDAKNKKVSKGRAAAMALTDIYGIEFGTAEDGMPVYEGAKKVWENYKAHLEKEVDMETAPIDVVNPVERLNELFPEAEFGFPDSNSKSGGFFRAQFTIDGNTYEGVGLSKKDAKANAAANTMDALEKNGQLAQRQADMEAKRKERQGKTNVSDKGKQEKTDSTGLSRIPTVKLHEIFPNVEYHTLGETPLRNTPIRAFITAAVIDEQSFIGVGKSKKSAKTAAAEKALQALGYWTEEDEWAKVNRAGVPPPPLTPLMGGMPADARMHSLFGRGGPSQYGRFARGRGRWSFGSGLRGYPQRGRGRGFAAGYDGEDWYGHAMGDMFGGESDDMMIGELSHLVGRILEANPNMGVSEVWNLLQQNPDYQFWRSGAVESKMQSMSFHEDYGDPFSAEYCGAFAHRPGYYPRMTARMGRSRGVNVRSWSRDTAPRGRKSMFPNFDTFW